MPLLPQKANTEGNEEVLGDRKPVPAGTYVCQIIKTALKQTKKKNGHYLELTYKLIEDEDFMGKMFWVRLNLDNPNKVAVEIANKSLNSICIACQLTDVEDSDELLDIPHNVTLKVSPGDGDNPPQNEAIAFSPLEDEVSGASESDDSPFKEEEPKAQEKVPEDVPDAPTSPKGNKHKLPWE